MPLPKKHPFASWPARLKIVLTVGLCLVSALLIITTFSFSTKYYIVSSGSMAPAIRTGALIMAVPQLSYQVGDIVTYRIDPSHPPVTHRIAQVRVSNGKISYVTQGDANNVADGEEVPIDMVLGKYRAQLPYVGYILAAGRHPIGAIFLIVIPSTLIIAYELSSIRQALKKQRRQRLLRVKATGGMSP